MIKIYSEFDFNYPWTSFTKIGANKVGFHLQNYNCDLKSPNKSYDQNGQ
jgi:hypothetical protein